MDEFMPWTDIEKEQTMANTGNEKGGMTVREAGRKGGQKTRDTYGPGFYVVIGKKGGRIGGKTTFERYGPEFYEEIGKKGGRRQKVRKPLGGSSCTN